MNNYIYTDSLRLQELVYGLKIKEVMTRDIFTLPLRAKMKEAKQILKKNHITGLPVVENSRVLGMISMNDVINALEKGSMEEPVTEWMSRDVQVLSEDMSLSFAFSAFNKYPYRRFPVVDKENRITGIITFRNINLALINKLSSQLNELEHSSGENIAAERISGFTKVYTIRQYDFENGGKASAEIKKILKEKKLPDTVVRRAAVACYELEINLAAHSIGGMLGIDINSRRIKISSSDLGPGIENVDKAMEAGFSTASEWIRSMGFGAGMGLPNVKKVSDKFNIHSESGVGTMVRSVIYINNQ